MKIYKMECPNCTAPLKIDRLRGRAVCEHCGAVFLMDEKNHMVSEEEYRRERENQTQTGSGGKKPKKRIWLWTLGWLLFIPAPLTVLIWRSKRLSRNWKWALIALVWTAFFLFAFRNSLKKKVQTFRWSDLILSEELPEPARNTGEIVYNSQESFNVVVRGVDSGEYNEYKAQCEDAGYELEEKIQGNLWSAYREDGGYVSLWYWDNEKEMEITFRAAKKLGTLHWPASALGLIVPEPDSRVGTIEYEDPEGFSITVGETDEEAYGDYVDRCMQYGFSKDYNRSNDYFHAENALGVSVYVQYEGFHVMSVRASARGIDLETTTEPESEEVTEETEPESEEITTEMVTEETTEIPEEPESSEEVIQRETETRDPGAVREDLRTFLEEYEAFVDRYCEMLGNYFSSDHPADLLTDYLKFTGEYLQWSIKAEKWGSANLTEAEMKLYTEVMLRCTAKVAALTQD